MSREVVFRHAAHAELKEAKAWYEDQREGLGAEFALNIEEAIERISKNPELYAIVRKDVRQALVRRKPAADGSR